MTIPMYKSKCFNKTNITNILIEIILLLFQTESLRLQ